MLNQVKHQYTYKLKEPKSNNFSNYLSIQEDTGLVSPSPSSKEKLKGHNRVQSLTTTINKSINNVPNQNTDEIEKEKESPKRKKCQSLNTSKIPHKTQGNNDLNTSKNSINYNYCPTHVVMKAPPASPHKKNSQYTNITVYARFRPFNQSEMVYYQYNINNL